MQPQIVRLRADIACFQEVNGQESPGQPRALRALTALLAGTSLQGASMISTGPAAGGVYDERNLVVVTHLPVTAHQQLRNDLVSEPLYKRLTAVPPDAAAVPVGVERPILHVQIDLGAAGPLHVINVHLKSKLPTDIPGQKKDQYTWRTADAWSEGSSRFAWTDARLIAPCWPPSSASRSSRSTLGTAARSPAERPDDGRY